MKKFYVYRITNITLQKHYYGSRGAEIPLKDLGIKYFSSSRDKTFIKDQKENSKNYKYKIIQIFKTRIEALKLEIKLHNKFNVGINERFYNRAKQSSSKFNTTGKVVVKDKEGNIFQISKNDPKYISGELVHHSKGTATVKDGNAKILSVKIDDPRYLSGELVGVAKGTKQSELTIAKKRNKLVVKDKDGVFLQVDVNDPRYLSGELVPLNKGRKHSEATKEKMKNKVVVKDKQGKIFKTDINDPRYLSGELVGINSKKVTVKDIFTGEKLSIDELTYKENKRYVGNTAKFMYLKDKEVFRRNDVIKKFGFDPRTKKHGYSQISLDEAKQYIKLKNKGS